MTPLPRIMVAPNGATLTKADHPALPVTISETVDCAAACVAAGADGLHAHVRGADGAHILDAGLYAELLAETARRMPDLYVQITTEAVGRYSPLEQRNLVEGLRPAACSIALREINAESDTAITKRFFAFCHEAGIDVQHILYDTADIASFAQLLADGTIPGTHHKALIVLGRYATGQRSNPADLDAPMAALLRACPGVDWGTCAFGPAETDCLLASLSHGGKARIGFENNRLNADGQPARDNAERVAELMARLPQLPPQPNRSLA